MRATLGRWGGFGAAAAAAMLVASVLALTLAWTGGTAPRADTAVEGAPSAPGTITASTASPTAAPALPVGVEQAGDVTYYTVQPFDIGRKEGTLAFIAARFGTTVPQLVAWNGIQDPNVIHPGQRLRVR
jgi:hypothetical protein